MKNLNSPFIPTVYDVEEDERYTYIIEQYIEGESLGAVLQKRLLSEKELFLYIIRISKIIEYLHSLPEKIYYLDIKPENIIISDDEVFLVDFGSATSKSCASESLRSGTVAYSAPEQIGGGNVDERTDIYALGRLLRVLTEHSNLSKHIMKKLIRISERACSKAFWNRISDADIFIRMLEKTRDGETGKKNKAKSRSAVLKGKRIGVMGLSHGCGSTTVVMSMAEYLSSAGYKKICVAEQKGCDDIGAYMCEAGCRRDEVTGAYVKGNIHYLTGVPEMQRIKALDQDYDCIVFDLGNDARSAISTMWLCDIRIVVGSAAPWRRKEYAFLRKLKDTMGELKRWFVFVSPADNKSLLDFGDYGAVIMPFPAEPDPLNPGAETMKFYEKVFGMIPQIT